MNLAAIDILIADDNGPMRALLKSYLTAHGARRMREAPSGQAALDMLNVRAADLVLLDHSMPGLSGLDVCRKLRASQNPSLSRIRVVMISGHGDAKLVAHARDAGVDEFLIKPVTMNDLLRRIEVAMTKGRAFVESNAFNGPDRRRRTGRAPAGADRRGMSIDLD